MQYDPDELPPPIRPRPTRPRLVGINDEHLARGRAALLSAQGSDISMEPTVTLQPMPMIRPMPEEDDEPTEPRLPSVRFKPSPVIAHPVNASQKDAADDTDDEATTNLKQLSGMMPAIRRPPRSSESA